MRKFLLILSLVSALALPVFSQRILFQSDFENIPLVLPDSLPAGWDKLDVDQNNPSQGWAVRDTTQVMGGNPSVNRPRAHSGRKSLHISWLAGTGGSKLNDDWVWTDSLRIQTGDSLIWWMLLGSIPPFAPYLDSVQVWVCSAQNPASTITKLATIKSNDSAGIPLSNNTWTQHKYSLSSYNGQRIYIAFRYYIPVQNALWCNIDDMLIGNRSAIGIHPISTEIPEKYSLSQNYPNPFNPSTNIEFSLPKYDFVTIKIYNSTGQEITTLLSENISAGTYKIDFHSASLSSGVYYYRIETSGGFSETKKMTILK